MNDAPEKIYGWLSTQLSLAKHYGGCSYQGASYVIDYGDPDRPLVRFDVHLQEAHTRKEKMRDISSARKSATCDMFGE